MDVTSIMSHINDCRARHGVAPLLWSDVLAHKAQDRVYIQMTLAGSTGAGSSDFGLNLVTRINGNFPDPTEACIHAIDKWRVSASVGNVIDVALSALTSCAAKMLSSQVSFRLVRLLHATCEMTLIPHNLVPGMVDVCELDPTPTPAGGAGLS